MRVLITGGAGFIGSHYADAFVQRGDEVTVFDSMPQVHECGAKYLRGDLKDRNAVDSAVRAKDLIIHAGGILGTHETVPSAYETSTSNILGSINVLDAVRKYGSNLINVSKPNVWLNPYSITKDCMEKFCFMYVNEFNIKVAIIKLFNVYGPRQKVSGVQKAIPRWIVSALRKEPLDVFGSGNSTMDLVFTRDVVSGTIGIVDNFDKCVIQRTSAVSDNVWSNFKAYNEQVLELGSGQEITVNDAVNEIKRAMHADLKIHYVEMRRGEIDGTRLCANISRVSRLTGFQPKVSLRDGLTETIAYYKEHLALIDQGVL